MEEALKPEKKITGGLGTRVATTTAPPRAAALSSMLRHKARPQCPKLPRSQDPDVPQLWPQCWRLRSQAVVPARKPGTTAAPPMVEGKKPKCPVWDLKGQLRDLNAELKCYGERKQVLDQENQQRWDQLREAQQQALARGAECRALGVDAGFDWVQAQAEQASGSWGT